MSSPWAKIENPTVVNLQDIMSEQKKKPNKFEANVADEIPQEVLNALKDEACYLDESKIPEEFRAILKENELVETDAEIAKILQAQFDLEHDEALKRCENRYNGGSKVSISFKNFMASMDNYKDAPLEECPEPRHWDRFETMDKQVGTIPLCGYKMNDGNIITKHDETITGRRNACKLLSFPPHFQTGDGEDIDMKIPNNVYNSLKSHSRSNQHSRRQKIRDKKEDRATANYGLDEHTHLQLYKMINNSRVLEAVGGIVSIGKEAAIFHAFGSSTNEEIPRECAIKVFKTTLSEFKDREKYIKSDPRFKDRIGKQTSRKTVHIWAEKEMANLCRLAKAGIPCPKVVMLKECVLVMSFIGENRIPAEKLKEAFLSPSEYILAYDQVISTMKTLFWDANLVHADLSEYNILWYKDKCYFIDVSQSVEPIHENAFEFLYRDCENITNFFERKSVPGVMSSNELFKSITGYYYEEKEQLLKLNRMEKPKPHNIDKIFKEETGDAFEKVWNNLETYNEMLKKNNS